MTAPSLPPGWSVELQGLSSTVVFRGPGRRAVTWTDGKWFVGNDKIQHPVPGIPTALTMAEARSAGSEFISAAECTETKGAQ